MAQNRAWESYVSSKISRNQNVFLSVFNIFVSTMHVHITQKVFKFLLIYNIYYWYIYILLLLLYIHINNIYIIYITILLIYIYILIYILIYIHICGNHRNFRHIQFSSYRNLKVILETTFQHLSLSSFIMTSPNI